MKNKKLIIGLALIFLFIVSIGASSAKSVYVSHTADASDTKGTIAKPYNNWDCSHKSKKWRYNLSQTRYL